MKKWFFTQDLSSIKVAIEIIPAREIIERDKIMSKLYLKFPEYGWNTNTGHGTIYHVEAIKKYGISKYHKTLFVKTAIENYEKKFKRYF